MTSRWSSIRAPDVCDESSGFVAWFIEPTGVLMSIQGQTHLTDGYADAFIGPMTWAVMSRRRGRERVLMIADWSTMTGYGSTVRQRMTSHVIDMRRDIDRLVAVIPEQRTMVRMGLSVARAALAVAGVDLDILHDVAILRERVPFSIAD